MTNTEIMNKWYKTEIGEILVHSGTRVKKLSKFKGIREDGMVLSVYRSTEPKLTPGGKANGYKSVSIDGKNKLVHRLVAEAFVTKMDSTHDVVDHKNENKEDNRAENLRWCTQIQNMKYYNNLKEGRSYKLLESQIVKLKQEKKDIAIATKEADKQLRTRMREVLRANKELEAKAKRIEAKMESMKIIAAKQEEYEDRLQEEGHSNGKVSMSKSVKVNGVEYASSRKAAKYIVSIEKDRQEETVRKEIRKFLQGKRKAWVMYGKYAISL